ncbi:MAG TPA: lysylphosphatidylglycerol synthase transmembrane domain-containing protein [Acidimicrobiales bacterium]|nr:lysylphosphatidylglycerol synthase transmembrane domain-containing protein [Acidimicrobiales bacterium]
MGLDDGAARPPVRDRVRRWLPAARVVMSVAILAVLLRKVHLHELAPKWDGSTIGWLLGALVLSVLAIALSTLRWRVVLSAMGVRARFRALFSTYLACQFLSSFLPSSIGGDTLRVTRLSSHRGRPDAPGSPVAFASVVLDRMSGWLVLPLLCLVGLAINPALRHLGRSSRLALTVSLASLAALAALLLLATHPRVGGRLRGRAGWLRFVGAVHEGIDRLRRRRGALAEVIAAAVLYQLAIIAVAVLATHALGLDADIGPTALLVFVPAVAIIQVLPVSFGGLGVREGALVVFLRPLGVTTAHAVALGLSLYGMQLLASLLGAPALAIGHGPPTSGPEMAEAPVAPAA